MLRIAQRYKNLPESLKVFKPLWMLIFWGHKRVGQERVWKKVWNLWISFHEGVGKFSFFFIKACNSFQIFNLSDKLVEVLLFNFVRKAVFRRIFKLIEDVLDNFHPNRVAEWVYDLTRAKTSSDKYQVIRKIRKSLMDLREASIGFCFCYCSILSELKLIFSKFLILAAKKCVFYFILGTSKILQNVMNSPFGKNANTCVTFWLDWESFLRSSFLTLVLLTWSTLMLRSLRFFAFGFLCLRLHRRSLNTKFRSFLPLFYFYFRACSLKFWLNQKSRKNVVIIYLKKF